MTKKQITHTAEPSEDEEAWAFNRNAIFDAMQQHSVSVIMVMYEGSGDSGQIDKIDLLGPSTLDEANRIMAEKIDYQMRHRSSDPPSNSRYITKPLPLEEAVEEICYQQLGDRHPGWELNEGSRGTFYFSVAARTVHLIHDQVRLEYDTTEEVF